MVLLFLGCNDTQGTSQLSPESAAPAVADMVGPAQEPAADVSGTAAASPASPASSAPPASPAVGDPSSAGLETAASNSPARSSPAGLSAKPTPGGGSPVAPSQAELQELARNSAILKLIGTRGDASSAADVWSEPSRVSIDEALSGISGVTIAGPQDAGGVASFGGGASVNLSHEGSSTAGAGTLPARHTVRPVASAAPGAVAVVLDKHLGRIKYCVEKENPVQGGKIEVAFDVLAGTATEVKLLANGTGDDELGTCVQAAARRFRFPTETDGSYTWAWEVTMAGE